VTNFSRRNVVMSAAAAGAAFGLDKQLAFFAPAEAKVPAQTIYEKGFHKFRVGDIEVITVYDGIAEGPVDGNFVPGVSADQLKAALIKGGHKGDVRPNFFTVTFVKLKGKTIMFDSSTGGQLAPTAGLMMAKNMYAAGIDPLKISTIIVTHFHPDHISGMISKETNSQVFPSAEIIVPATEYKHWTDPSLLGKVPDGQKGLVTRIQATFPKWKNLRQIEGDKADKEVMPGIRSVDTYGHTPGHTSYIVSSGRNQVMILGDVTNIPAINLANPDWSIGFDNDKAMAAATRRRVFDRAIADKMVMTGYHWGMPGAGKVKKDGNGYAFLPVQI
jgi:glyoxylase-like metal-dependent hydrolase (beta-lactamase superfamily II)